TPCSAFLSPVRQCRPGFSQRRTPASQRLLNPLPAPTPKLSRPGPSELTLGPRRSFLPTLIGSSKLAIAAVGAGIRQCDSRNANVWVQIASVSLRRRSQQQPHTLRR